MVTFTEEVLGGVDVLAAQNSRVRFESGRMLWTERCVPGIEVLHSAAISPRQLLQVTQIFCNRIMKYTKCAHKIRAMGT